MEAVVERGNLKLTYRRVVENEGSAGVFAPADAADAAAGVVFHEACGLAAAAVTTV